MDLTDFRSYYTVVLLVIFIGIWAWAWSRSNKSRFSSAANSLFDENEEKMHAESMRQNSNDNKNSAEKES